MSKEKNTNKTKKVGTKKTTPKKTTPKKNVLETGTVLHYNPSRKMGYIRVERTNEDVLVSKSGLIDEIKENDKVTFKLKPSNKGPVAYEVRVVKV